MPWFDRRTGSALAAVPARMQPMAIKCRTMQQSPTKESVGLFVGCRNWVLRYECGSNTEVPNGDGQHELQH